MAVLLKINDKLGITGPKYGCGMKVCKACTCLVNGSAVTACSTTVSSVAGFLFSSRGRHTSAYGDWSSDVCSSDLRRAQDLDAAGPGEGQAARARRHPRR